MVVTTLPMVEIVGDVTWDMESSQWTLASTIIYLTASFFKKNNEYILYLGHWAGLENYKENKSLLVPQGVQSLDG